MMPELELDELTIHYEHFGDGPDIVWVSGAGDVGSRWHKWQVPYFESSFRNTTFDNRGIGKTTCLTPPPWDISDFARDAAALIEAVCEPPIAVVGLSMGSFIVNELALDRPDLLRCAIAMGTAANGSTGWLGDYMRAEVDLRRNGGQLGGMFATTHYAAELYPARALGDEDLWPEIKAWLGRPDFLEENERSLIPQWQACIDFDVVERLPNCTVPLHVFAFNEDVQAPPQYGKQVADLAPTGQYHLFEGMGHCSIFGHTHEILNQHIKETIERYI
jgi:pimeloyl-ACP methyl ester carboxylesterase